MAFRDKKRHNKKEKLELQPLWIQCIRELLEDPENNQNIEITAKQVLEKAKIYIENYLTSKNDISELEKRHINEIMNQRFRSICYAMRKVMEDNDIITYSTEDVPKYSIKYNNLGQRKKIEKEDIIAIINIIVNMIIKNMSIDSNVLKKTSQYYVSDDKNLKNKVINEPTVSEVNFYLEEWKKMEKYVFQERALKKLFIETYPNNVDIEDILIKVSSLNDFYSTNIKNPYRIAQHILYLNIDEKLKEHDFNIINEIADVKINEETSKYFFSFATKYCSHHKPDIYPIYDNYVDHVLKYFNSIDKFYDSDDNDFKDYRTFRKVLLSFQKTFDLNNFSLKEIDRYLWLIGKKYFPKNYKKRKPWKN
jgi:hypothetical protein